MFLAHISALIQAMFSFGRGALLVQFRIQLDRAMARHLSRLPQVQSCLPALFFVAEVYWLSHMQFSKFMILFLLWTIQHACFFFLFFLPCNFQSKFHNLIFQWNGRCLSGDIQQPKRIEANSPLHFFIFGSFISLRCTSQYTRKYLSQLPFYIATLSL